MCTIVGILSLRKPRSIKKMVDVMVHRGPDGSGFYEDDKIPKLRRDLLPKGHTFRTETDVEVILHLYEEKGRNCVKFLRGMFAFNIRKEFQ